MRFVWKAKRGSVAFSHPYKKEVFFTEGGEVLELVAQRNCVCPIIGNVQSQISYE